MQVEEIRQGLGGIKGVGPRTLKQLATMGIKDVGTLLWHLPRTWDDRTRPVSFAEARKACLALDALDPLLDEAPGRAAEDRAGVFNTTARVLEHQRIGRPPRAFLKILVDDGTTTLSLLCFNRDFLARTLVPGLTVHLYGKGEVRYHEFQSSSFEYRLGDGPPFGEILPVYPLAKDLNQGVFRKVIPQALRVYGLGISENLPPALREKYRLMDRATAFSVIHQPPAMEDLAQAKRRLVYEELFFLQLHLARARQARAGTRPIPAGPGTPPPPPGLLARQLMNRLPFSLTAAQDRVYGEIRHDLALASPMSRLVQGDVGCGKTILALLAALEVVGRGYQAAIMAPTVLLARQHAEKAAALLEPLGITVALHAGGLRKSQKDPLKEAIAQGRAQVIIGTHGLFSPDLVYHRLGLVVIDEQHRFGVRQREALYRKTEAPHLLMMTATPIPQTLALTLFGDMDVSVVDQLPPGRKAIETHLTRLGNEEKTYQWVEKELKAGRQAYFVYPRIEDEGESDGPSSGPGEASDDEAKAEARSLKSAEAMAAQLQQRYPSTRVVLVHGRMAEEEKTEAMHAFTQGEAGVLVATSVVEVGVDVPNATCMVVEHAERFGMAALHQLRGRVGRGDWQSWCFLLYDPGLSEEGKLRLRALKDHGDGFVLAEKDLEIRGPGDLAGTAQSGYVRLRIADLVRDAAVMVQAREDARDILARDPDLALPEHQGMARTLELAGPGEEES